MCSAEDKSHKSYFEQNTKGGDVSHKLFWKTIRPFLSNEGTHDNHDIILEENGNLIKDKENISDILNDLISTLTLLTKPLSLIKNDLGPHNIYDLYETGAYVSWDIGFFTLKNGTMTFLMCSIMGQKLFQQDYL